jgi:hypothetical protein
MEAHMKAAVDEVQSKEMLVRKTRRLSEFLKVHSLTD